MWLYAKARGEPNDLPRSWFKWVCIVNPWLSSPKKKTVTNHLKLKIIKSYICLWNVFWYLTKNVSFSENSQCFIISTKKAWPGTGRLPNCAIQLLCWDKKYHLPEEHTTIPALSDRGCLAHRFLGRRDNGLSLISGWFGMETQDGLVLVSRGWLRPHSKQQAGQSLDTYSRLIANDGLASLP